MLLTRAKLSRYDSSVPWCISQVCLKGGNCGSEEIEREKIAGVLILVLFQGMQCAYLIPSQVCNGACSLTHTGWWLLHSDEKPVLTWREESRGECESFFFFICPQCMAKYISYHVKWKTLNLRQKSTNLRFKFNVPRPGGPLVQFC